MNQKYYRYATKQKNGQFARLIFARSFKEAIEIVKDSPFTETGEYETYRWYKNGEISKKHEFKKEGEEI